MTTFIITYAEGAYLGQPGDRPTETDTHDIAYYCSAFCAHADIGTLAEDYPLGDAKDNPAGTAWGKADETMPPSPPSSRRP
jgi:hypothetical protein